MLRKMIVLLCIISIVPASVSAEVFSAVAAAQSEVATAAPGSSTQPGGEVNLMLSAEKSSSILLASAETPQGTTAGSSADQKKESKSAFNWGNFAEVHLGDYRWIWWVGAAGALVAIHAGK